MPRRPKAEFTIVQHLDYVTCGQWVRGRGHCNVLVLFMPGELPQACAAGHLQPQHGTAYVPLYNVART